MYIHRENLIRALSLAIQAQGKIEKNSNFYWESCFLRGIMELYDEVSDSRNTLLQIRDTE